MTKNISVIGLGKLGASMAAAFASRGMNVIGVDVNLRSIELVNEGSAPVQETNLGETIAANKERIPRDGKPRRRDLKFRRFIRHRADTERRKRFFFAAIRGVGVS